MGDMDVVSPKGRVLIMVENLSVPFDRRVWAESLALAESGYGVSVICPASPGEPLRETLSGVSIYRYPAPAGGDGIVSYLREFLYSMWAALRLSMVVYRREGFDVIQGCNPPDTFFAIGLFYKLLLRKKFIFDHHDLSPELFSVRFQRDKKSLVYRILVWLERRSLVTADVVISTNESFRARAIKRGRKSPDSVVVVRNGPNLNRFRPTDPKPELRMGREHMVCYVGVMAVQDGVDYLLRAVDHIVNSRSRRDTTFTLIGDGDEVVNLQKLARDLGIEEYVVFTGRISDDVLLATYLSTADVCVAPDPDNGLNDKCTLIKIAEYMAMGKPVVSFDLAESRYSAQDAALYAEDDDPVDFAEKIIALLDAPELRAKMGEFGQARVREALSWEHSKVRLIEAYDKALGRWNSD